MTPDTRYDRLGLTNTNTRSTTRQLHSSQCICTCKVKGLKRLKTLGRSRVKKNKTLTLLQH